ncbi:MAG: hypothetical protein KAX16_03710 [Actinomycetia bacterium]|nr:hypothetical protein [Actinomycetes bacterium]
MQKGGHTRLGIASLVLGIIALISDYKFIFSEFILGPFIFGLLAAMFGYMSYFSKRKDGVGLTGLILGIISIIYGAAILVG